MTRQDALDLIAGYQSVAANTPHPIAGILYNIRERFPTCGSEAKAMRWLGFCQGVLFAAGVYSINQLKNHSRFKLIGNEK